MHLYFAVNELKHCLYVFYKTYRDICGICAVDESIHPY